jgi:hypothetical protein
MLSERLLFTLRDQLGRAHPVYYWQHYGVVCPSLYTTNGSIRLAAECIVCDLSRGLKVVEGDLFPTEVFTSVDKLTAALRAILPCEHCGHEAGGHKEWCPKLAKEKADGSVPSR